MTSFRFAGGDQRTTIMGATGSGKSTCGLWMLAHQRLDVRPWIIFDFKREEFFDRVGFPPITAIGLDSKPPKKPGLYLVAPRPGEDDAVEAFIWRIWERGNCGLYVDEAPLMPNGSNAFQACIQQGRSEANSDHRLHATPCRRRPGLVLGSGFCRRLRSHRQARLQAGRGRRPGGNVGPDRVASLALVRPQAAAGPEHGSRPAARNGRRHAGEPRSLQGVGLASLDVDGSRLGPRQHQAQLTEDVDHGTHFD